MRTLPPIFMFTAALLVFAGGMAAVAQDIEPPPHSEEAEDAIANSPRHQEFVDIDLPGTDVKLKTWAVYPERPDKAPVVIVIHEIFGMTDWVNSVADHLAKQGFIALAPDMISGTDPEENAMRRVRGLSREEIVKRLNAVHAYAVKIPAANGNTASIGFCWGGSASFIYATAQPELDAAVVFYGSAPEKEELAKVECPVLGCFGENDARVNVTITRAAEQMEELGKSFEYKMYDGAGHGFVRSQTTGDGSNARAAEEAWARAVAFLREHTETE